MKIILGHEYIDYETACIDCNLETLTHRREKRLLKFSIKCLDNPANSSIFPRNAKSIGGEIFKVNFARTAIYMKSAIPQAQRMLNKHFRNYS